MKPPTLIASGSLDRLLQAGNAAWDRRDFQECIETLQRASNVAPSNADILLRLGHVQGLRYNYAAAERCFEQALRVAPRKGVMLVAIAEHCRDFRNPTLAERYLRKALEALEQTNVWPPTCLELAKLCERTRRLSEATQLVDRVLAAAPAYPAALLLRARLERTTGRLEAAEHVLRSFITKPIPLVWTHAQAWYELATVLDRQEKYDEAMMAFLNAKSLLQPQAPGHLQALKQSRAYLKVMEDNVSAEMLRRWFENGPVLPPARRLALLCGHARSGTTMLEQLLDSHPDIVSVEESPVFLNDAYLPLKRKSSQHAHMLPTLEAADIPALQLSRAAYFRSMELEIGGSVAGRLLLDKNPVINYLVPAFVRIFPETRFIVALRDPRDVVLSCFMQPHQLNAVTAAYLNLETTVEDYSAVMSLWRTLAPLVPAPFLEVRYEDMVEDLESIARKTLDFLGVPWEARVLNFDEHARSKMVLSPTYADVTQPVYQRAVGRWRNYQKYLEPHLEKLEPFVKAFGYE
jgi:tetratricopeptide (TPR) repeat protein